MAILSFSMSILFSLYPPLGMASEYMKPYDLFLSLIFIIYPVPPYFLIISILVEVDEAAVKYYLSFIIA